MNLHATPLLQCCGPIAKYLQGAAAAAAASAAAGAETAEGFDGAASALREESMTLTAERAVDAAAAAAAGAGWGGGRAAAAAGAGWGGGRECAVVFVSKCVVILSVEDLVLDVRGVVRSREDEDDAETAEDDGATDDTVKRAAPLATASASAAVTLLPAVGSGRVCRGT